MKSFISLFVVLALMCVPMIANGQLFTGCNGGFKTRRHVDVFGCNGGMRSRSYVKVFGCNGGMRSRAYTPVRSGYFEYADPMQFEVIEDQAAVVFTTIVYSNGGSIRQDFQPLLFPRIRGRIRARVRQIGSRLIGC